MLLRLRHSNSFRLNCLFLSTLALFILNSCGKDKDGQDDYNDYISFDKSKLGIEIIDQELGIKFYPPINWDLRQSSISRKFESRGSSTNPNENFIYEPTYVFFDDSTGGLLSVGKIVTNDTTLTKSTRLNFYKGLLSKKYKENDLSIGKFVYSKIYFTQFKFKKENLISLKIIFENAHSDIIQFDYTIPSNHLEGTEPSLKSSIGSIILK